MFSRVPLTFGSLKRREIVFSVLCLFSILSVLGLGDERSDLCFWFAFLVLRLIEERACLNTSRVPSPYGILGQYATCFIRLFILFLSVCSCPLLLHGMAAAL